MAIVQNSLKTQNARVPAAPIRSPRGNWPWSAFQATLVDIEDGNLVPVFLGTGDAVYTINLALFTQDVPVMCWATNAIQRMGLYSSFFGASKQEIVSLTATFDPSSPSMTIATPVGCAQAASININGITERAYPAYFQIDDGVSSMPVSVSCISGSGVIAGPPTFVPKVATAYGDGIYSSVLLTASSYAAVRALSGFDPQTYQYTSPSGDVSTIVGAFDPVLTV